MEKIENIKNIGKKQSNMVEDLNMIESHQQIMPRNKVTDESDLLTNKIWLKLASDSHTFGVIIAQNEKWDSEGNKEQVTLSSGAH